MRIVAFLICLLVVAGCRGEPVLDVPVTQDLVNARFENGAIGWKFAADQSNGKIKPQEGILGSYCAALTLGPHQQYDCFSQAVRPMHASTLDASVYVRASGQAKAWLRLECIDPDQYDNLHNYGQLAEANSQPCPTDGQWHLLTAQIRIPKRTQHVRVFGYANGTNGIVYFDDFNIVRK